MVKEKKGKKGNREEDLGDELEPEVKKKPSSEMQKSKKDRRKRNDDWEDDVASEIASLTVDDKLSKAGNDEEEEEQIERKKPKKKTRKVFDNDDTKSVDLKNTDMDNTGDDSSQSSERHRNISQSCDDDNDSALNISKTKSAAKGKKGKGKAASRTVDDEVENITSPKSLQDTKLQASLSEKECAPAARSSKKIVKPKSMFELLATEDSDIDIGSHSDNEENSGDADSTTDLKPVNLVTKSKKNKEGKKSKKEATQEEEEVDCSLAEIDKDSTAIVKTEAGEKEAKKSKEGKKSKKEMKKRDDEEIERILAEIELGDKKKTKAVKKKDDEEEIEKALSEIELGDKKKTKAKQKEDIQEVEEKGITVVAEIPEDEEDEKPKKKGKKKKDTDETKVGTKTEEQDNEGEESTVKSAAQKKKEKKEKERQKKLAQKAQIKDKIKEESPVVESKLDISTAETGSESVIVEAAKGETEAKEDDGEGDDTKKKTDKKKKKTEKDKGDKEKKGPGKKQILAMQEALKKIKEDEEKRRLDEEAKEKAAEEAELLRQEKLRLEQERKERKKLKEKEKRERLKAEGKLLSQAQKQQRARAQAMLESLRAQGLDVPKIGERKERVPRPGDRIRVKKSKMDQTENEDVKEGTPDSATDSVSITAEVMTEDTLDDQEIKDEPDANYVSDQNSDESVKDAWDESSDEMEDDEQLSPVKGGKTHADSKKDSEDDESSKGSDSSSEEESSSDSEDESDSEGDDQEHKHQADTIQKRVLNRILKRREENEKNRSLDKLRSPVVCVLGHVDTGKTKILDKIRHTHVQDSEAGGITQQIGATMVPLDAIREQAKMVKGFSAMELKIPGLLIIDTPGHESFSNLRSRGSSLCDIAILVVDIMHGLEPQTIESINLLKQKKTPFVVALNKVDRLYDWKTFKNKDIQDTIKAQNRNALAEFDERVKNVILQFAEQGLNATLCYDNKDPRTFISLVPSSALTGDGMGNLMALIVDLTQTMMAKRLTFSEELQATVLEVKAIPGLGTTIDVILVNGRMRETDTLIVAGIEGPLVTQIRSLLMPQPLKELRVKNPYEEFKEVEGAQGVKIAGKDLEKAIAGLNMMIAHHPDEVEFCKEEVAKELQVAMNSIKLAERGVYVQASTLGSLEALLEFLTSSKIPYSGIRIGPVVKKDVMKASIMLEHDNQFAVILAFDVKIERDAQELADSLGVKIFSADIIYHLFDKFMAHREELRQKKRDQFKHVAVFPCRLRILPQYIFNTRDPIVVGVSVEAGVVREGTPLCVPSKEFLDIGIVTTIEINHKPVDSARKGQEVCLKIEPIPGESPKLYGRHFDFTDHLVSKISRQSIDACKDYFRDDLQKSDWQLMVDLKKLFKIM